MKASAARREGRCPPGVNQTPRAAGPYLAQDETGPNTSSLKQAMSGVTSASRVGAKKRPPRLCGPPPRTRVAPCRSDSDTRPDTWRQADALQLPPLTTPQSHPASRNESAVIGQHKLRVPSIYRQVSRTTNHPVSRRANPDRPMPTQTAASRPVEPTLAIWASLTSGPTLTPSAAPFPSVSCPSMASESAATNRS